jgi:NAD(P)-dependent dehydrogenase (short-subunit alcohol dehydrogenase family)
VNLAQSISGRLTGRRIFLTGGASGIGRATAERLAAERAFVTVTDRDREAAEAVAGAIRQQGGRALALVADVSDERSVSDAVARAAHEAGGLDAVVTCAGVLHAAPTEQTSLELWQLTLRVNLTGTFLAVRECIPHLLDAGGGSVVTIGSVASLVAGGYASSYDASKGAVLQFTRAVGVEYADRGIRANCVCPGAVATNLKRTSAEVVGPLKGQPAKYVQAPMDRHADPAELAAVVAFLCSDDSTFMTGSAVVVDGGLTAV